MAEFDQALRMEEAATLLCPGCGEQVTVSLRLDAGERNHELEMLIVHGKVNHRGVNVVFSQVVLTPNDDER